MKELPPFHGSYWSSRLLGCQAFADECMAECEETYRRLRRRILDKLYESYRLLLITDKPYREMLERLHTSQMEMTRLCLSGEIAPAYAELFRRCMHLFAEARAGTMVSLFIHGILAVEQSIPDRQWVNEIIGHGEWRPLLIDLLLNQSGDEIKCASYPDPMFEWAVKALAPCRLKMPKTPLEDIIEQLDDMGAGGEIPSGCIMAEQRFTDIMVKVTWYELAVYLVQGLYTPLYSDDSGKELDAFKAEIIQEAAAAQNMAVLPIDAMLLWQEGVTRVTVPVRRITGRRKKA